MTQHDPRRRVANGPSPGGGSVVVIKNATVYCTRDLGRLLYRVAKDELNPGDMKAVTVEVAYHRSNTMRRGGAARVGSLKRGAGWMKVLVPHPNVAVRGLDVIELAHTIAHEMAHLRGLQHRWMRGSRYRRIDGYRERYSWATAYVVRMNVPRGPTSSV